MVAAVERASRVQPPPQLDINYFGATVRASLPDILTARQTSGYELLLSSRRLSFLSSPGSEDR